MAMTEEAKAAAVEEWLRATFKDLSVNQLPDPEHARRRFYRIDDKEGNVRHRLFIASELLSDTSAADILRLLEKWEVAATIRKAGQQIVIVTKGGPHIQS